MSRLGDLIKLLRGHRVFIQTHNFPDPDAIASAYGLQNLLNGFDIPTTICHHGRTERAATANMISAFGIEMTTDEELKDMTEEDYIINVDSQKGNANIRELIGQEIACIDHHPESENSSEYLFKDIRIVGSCATIIADYYRKHQLPMKESVATALLYGLKCDTNDFTRGVTQLDVDIYSYLFPKSNASLIRYFQSGEIEYDELNAFADSMRNVEVFNGVAFVYLNFACADAFIATISDFVLDVNDINFVVVYNHRDDGFKFSVRSELDELDAGEIISEALKDVGSGGGHKSMAGGYAYEDSLIGISIDYHKTIQNLFLNVIDKIPRKGIDVNAVSNPNEVFPTDEYN